MGNKYVVLEGVEFGNKFFTLYTKDTPIDDYRYSGNGELWYNVLGVVNNMYDAWCLIYGDDYARFVCQSQMRIDNKPFEYYTNN